MLGSEDHVWYLWGLLSGEGLCATSLPTAGKPWPEEASQRRLPAAGGDAGSEAIFRKRIMK